MQTQLIIPQLSRYPNLLPPLFLSTQCLQMLQTQSDKVFDYPTVVWCSNIIQVGKSKHGLDL
jgi:hypothetical protein